MTWESRYLFRRQPPVHSTVKLVELLKASRGLWRSGNVGALERARAALGERYPDREILLTSSGTVALSLALAATRRGEDAGLVALPAYGCPDIGTAAIGAGYRVVLYDLDPDTFAPDMESVDACLAEGATHVVVTHLCGRIVDPAPVMAAARTAGATVIEDAAQHAGGTLHGARGGTLCDWSILSFGRGKGLNAGGGGALLRKGHGRESGTSLPSATLFASGRTLLSATVTSLLSHPNLYWLPASLPLLGLGETAYHAPAPARSITAISALLLDAALRAEGGELATRRANERAYVAGVTASRAVTLLAATPGSDPGALRFPLRVEPSQAAPLASLGVTRLYPRTLAAYPAIASVLAGKRAHFPGSETLAAGLHTLPTHPLLTGTERERIIDALNAAGRS